jgi:PIN domain nuclease of toxin-antitoxin system
LNLLLDTHAFIWWNAHDRRLADVARNAIREPGKAIAEIRKLLVGRTI